MDPLRNNNTPAVRRIAKRSLKANRTRNIFAVCAIILTTFMLSSVFTIGSSLLHNLQIMEIRNAGTIASIFLKGPSDGQIAKIKEQDQVTAAGLQIAIGEVSKKTDAGKDMQINMAYFDKAEWQTHYQPAISGIQGSYPQSYNEIMLSKRALKQLNITKPQNDQVIKLSYATKHGKATKDFRLSGWYTDYGFSQSGMALLSEAFTMQEGFTAEDDGRLSISCAPGKSNRCLDQLKDNIVLKKGQDYESSFDPQQKDSGELYTIIGTLLALALFIVLSGYLLIYNVIYISVTKDIQFYGLLKTIGAAPKQIKKLVRSQILRLAVIGIPAGLLLGFATSFIIVPYSMGFFTSPSDITSMPGDVNFNPWIFIATALFSLLTILISCRKPAKIAGKVSPVEALKFTGVSSSGKQKDKKSRSGGKLWRMAFHNVFRGKKRSLLVFASLFMGTITFLGVNSFIGSLGVDNYINNYAPNDFEIISQPPITQKFDKDYLRSLSQIDGVTSMETASAQSCLIAVDKDTLEPVLRASYERYGQGQGAYEEMVSAVESMSKEGKLNVWVQGIDDHYVTDYNRTHKQQIDVDAFRRGKIAILGYDDGSRYKSMLGRSLKLTPEGKSQSKTIEVGGIFNREDCSLNSSYGTVLGMMDIIFVSDTFMKKLKSDPTVTNIILNASQEKEPYVKQQIKSLNKTLVEPSFEFMAKTDQAEFFKSSMTSLNVLGNGISILLLIIGILNFINVMLTSVYARRQELAVMESVGMTKRQIKNMLTLEGAFYAFITTCIIMTVGNALLYLLSQSVTTIADYAVFQYPVMMTALLVQLLFIICLIVPRIVFRATSRESVTERLHQIDN